jgi:beta-glucanase (GH16 family)
MFMLQPIILLCSLFVSTCFSDSPKAGKKLVWSDEFNISGMPDPAKWDYELGYVRNKELQYYTKRKENARIENGNLIIEARMDSFSVDGKVFPVTSASLVTRNRAEWKYGYIEVRAKIPSSLGTWPAIWMLGTNIKEVGWPACGEIDIMEHVGYDPHKVHAYVHTKAYNHSINTQKGQATEILKPFADFQTYAVDWTKEKMDFYLNDKKVFTFKNEGKGEDAWPFDRPFYLILNLAFGGSWGGQKGVDHSSLPQQFIVDYVRVYQ